MPSASQPAALYRFYDADKTLLYIGITNSIGRRFDQHSADKPWYAKTSYTTIEHYPSRAIALEAEKAAIKAERPVHNVQHNDRPKLAADGGQWYFRSRRSGHEFHTDLYLYPELDCSAMVDDHYELDGEGQFEEYTQYVASRYPDWINNNAVPIVWSVHSGWGRGIFEAAPFTSNEPSWGDFLTHFTWPSNTKTGERLDWFQLPVVNDRFPDFAQALAWTPSPLQPTCPLRSLLDSRSGRHPARQSKSRLAH